MSESKARRLLKTAAGERDRLQRHLLVAASLRELFGDAAIVVGGTAEEYWTADEYHETDLDVCMPLGKSERRELEKIGFAKDGRHWVRSDVAVAIEFPDSRIDGDTARCVLVPVGDGEARIIGLDDLYLDRLRQATMQEDHEGVEFHSALAVAAACFDRIDWPYVRAKMKEISNAELAVGASMRRLDSKLRGRVRRYVDE